ncbi:MAG: hypothetical protein JRC99_08825 [Deltaproteobacteria bacterium]|nr:hypothetical protein [Deltaproteobacteria bacterium]
MGLTVVAEDDAGDLLVRFFFKEGPDLDADGDLLTRLKSFHVQFVAPDTEAFVAVADYFYADNLPVQVDESVAEVFAALRQDILVEDTLQPEPAATATVPSPTVPVEKNTALPRPNNKPVLKTPVPLASPNEASDATTQPTATAPSTTAPVEKNTALPQQNNKPVLKTRVPLASPNEASDATTQPTVKATNGPVSTDQPAEMISPATDKSNARTITPKTQSPWIPRFDSWGFENWGKETDDIY